MRSNPKLHRLYLQLNRKWFGNKLPKDTICVWSRALNREPLQAELDDEAEPLIIRLNSHLRRFDNLTEYNLLHECAHIATLSEADPHGPRWQREMMRLARARAFEHIW